MLFLTLSYLCFLYIFNCALCNLNLFDRVGTCASTCAHTVTRDHMHVQSVTSDLKLCARSHHTCSFTATRSRSNVLFVVQVRWLNFICVCLLVLSCKAMRNQKKKKTMYPVQSISPYSKHSHLQPQVCSLSQRTFFFV